MPVKRFILVLFIAVPTFLEGQDTPHLAWDLERMVLQKRYR